MGIAIEKDENGQIYSISINNIELEAGGDESFIVPKDLLRGIKLEEMPKNISFEICDKIEDNVIHLSTIPFYISKTGINKARIFFEDFGTREYWDGDIGFKLYMETKKELIKEREKEIRDVIFESYDDDGNYIHLGFSTEIESETFDSIINYAEQIISEIGGSVEIELGSTFKKIDKIKDEKEFALTILLPLIRKLGFPNIRYTHGNREFGKDITFSRHTEFDEYEFWGAQVKHGNISGGANAEIDNLIAQVDDAFKVPFYDVYTKQKQHISKLLIAISGKFTDNAIEKICEKIESHSARNNLVFVDGEKIKTLIEKLRK